MSLPSIVQPETVESTDSRLNTIRSPSNEGDVAISDAETQTSSKLDLSNDGEQHESIPRNIKRLQVPGPFCPLENREYVDTNESLVSENSNYQNILSEDEGVYDFASYRKSNDHLMPDPYSRPLSQNSTTSCLSTTATKDGIQGKRLRRFGPSAYVSDVISNMNDQLQDQTSVQSPPESFENDGVRTQNDDRSEYYPESMDVKPQNSQNASVVSLHQTSIRYGNDGSSKISVDNA
ncbi:uncharacterized protein LODBEIA_P30100 [Lodderomyces beijingensis]|uniref:Uncharacterized protein n=1 Tax=Lodderomyces beijingensis TaxID=1775926 RepID=A0ABP0ZKW5_9ASCO